jgi:PAS domain S-box-containing protein
MEDALRKSESRFRSFVENANDIIFMMDTNGVFTYISPNWETMIGRNHTSFIGETFEPLVHPDDIPACHAFLKRIITTREKAENLEYRVRHNDGNWLWHSSNGASIFDSAGELIGGIGIARDITNRKQVETYREMGRQVLQIINDIGDLCESILGILKILKTQTGADAVGIRLKDGDDFPYFA